MKEKEKNVPLLLMLSSKKCACCGEVKPTTEFTRHKKREKRGFYSYCKECANKRTKKYQLDNPEKCKIMYSKINLKKLYGLTIEDVERILKNQNYKCAICGREIFLHGAYVDKSKIARVDHDHKTGKVRGLLCNECNRGIGFLKDNPMLLANAIKYLEN